MFKTILDVLSVCIYIVADPEFVSGKSKSWPTADFNSCVKCVLFPFNQDEREDGKDAYLYNYLLVLPILHC
jgi:hypothetical protein